MKNFLKRRQELLSDKHGQGFTWKSHFSWLWKIISFFLPASWRKRETGSKLRSALAYDFPLGKSEFELSPLSALKKCAEGGTTSLASYQKSLIEQFDKSPSADLADVYRTYLNDMPEIPTPEEFLEQFFLARILVTRIVRENADIRQSLYSALKLLILLQSQLKKELISVLNTDSFYSLNNAFEALYQKAITYEILPKLKVKVPEVLYTKHTTIEPINNEISPYDSPLVIAEDVFEYLKPPIDPLLLQVARLICEAFLQTFYSGKMGKKTRNNIGLETISFLRDRLLPNTCTSFDTISEGIDLLSPMLNCDAIPPEYKYAELCASTLILTAASCDPESVFDTAARSHDVITRDFSSIEKDWIIYRVSDAYPFLKDNLLKKYGNDNTGTNQFANPATVSLASSPLAYFQLQASELENNEQACRPRQSP